MEQLTGIITACSSATTPALWVTADNNISTPTSREGGELYVFFCVLSFCAVISATIDVASGLDTSARVIQRAQGGPVHYIPTQQCLYPPHMQVYLTDTIHRRRKISGFT